ncbi:DUF87 domain-containing protein (plasmid) [Sulfolobus tengchongensis]|uniref:DUF87 domain-containing protein n=1 Tax=Sulfolobus tengchongensis TaxID=207809 RepID=A0AAX4L117_9CREN
MALLDIFKSKNQKKTEQKTQKPKERPQKQLNVYQLEPGPFEILSDEERDQLEQKFLQILNVVDKGTIYIQASKTKYQYEDEEYEVLFNKFYLITEANLDYPKGELTRKKVKRALPRYVILEDNTLAQAAVFYKFPDLAPEGMLFEYFGLGDIVIKWESLDPVSAASAVDRSRKRLESLGSTDSIIIRKLEKVKQLQAIVGGQAKLLRLWAYLIIYGQNEAELKQKFMQARIIARSRLFDLDIPVFYQKALYNLETSVASFIPFTNTVKPVYVDTITASWEFYPLISEDLIDADGIFLGFSDSGSPVLFNPYMRNNHNIVILGETGSGKSMTLKILLKRMKEKYKIKIWGIDPENEYVKLAEILGFKGIVVQRGTKLGLDPVLMAKINVLNPEDIAELLAEFYLPDDIALRNRLRAAVFDVYDESSDLFDLIERIKNQDEQIYKYLEAAKTPPDVYIFEAEDKLETTENIVFGLREISGQGATRLKALITTLLAAIFQREAFSNREKGFVFVDEGWLFVNYPITMALLENLSRRARKYSKGLIFATQRPADVVNNDSGRTILEQSATVFLLRQRSQSLQVLKQTFALRDEEAQELLQAEPGHGILRTGNYLLRLYVQPSKEEFEAFKTTGEW